MEREDAHEGAAVHHIACQGELNGLPRHQFAEYACRIEAGAGGVIR